MLHYCKHFRKLFELVEFLCEINCDFFSISPGGGKYAFQNLNGQVSVEVFFWPFFYNIIKTKKYKLSNSFDK